MGGQRRSNLPQSVADWKRAESRIPNVIKIHGATTGHRNSYIYDFEATSEVSVTESDGHIYIYTNAQQLWRQDLLPRLPVQQLMHFQAMCPTYTA